MEPTRAFICLNCQCPLKIDSAHKKPDEADRKHAENEGDEAYHGQARNLMKLICDAQCPADAPVCKECCDALLVGMDSQLASLEEECLSYKQFLEYLKTSHPSSSVSDLKSTLQNLQDQEKALENELQKLLIEEKNIDEELQEKRRKNETVDKQTAKMFNTYRDHLRNVIETEDDLKTTEAELRYADLQHRRLADTNILDFTFHIWIDSERCIGEINGFRLGRLPDVLVEWTEINAAWGQAVLLMDVLFEKLGIRHPQLVPVAMGSHSYIKLQRNGIDAETYPLYGSGNFFNNNNCVDKGITNYLKLLSFLHKELKDRNNAFNVPYRIGQDRFSDNGIDFRAVMMLNTDVRWTRAMAMLLSDLKTATVQCVSLRPPA